MKEFLVEINKESPLFEKFKDWHEDIRNSIGFIYNFKYYGYINGIWNCFDTPKIPPISLEQWYEEFIWKPKEGETIEASLDEEIYWQCFFVCKYGSVYIVANSDDDLIKVNYIRKHNPLSEDIKKLKKKAKDLGLKIDIIYEAIQ